MAIHLYRSRLFIHGVWVSSVGGLRQLASTMANAPEMVMGFASGSNSCGWWVRYGSDSLGRICYRCGLLEWLLGYVPSAWLLLHWLLSGFSPLQTSAACEEHCAICCGRLLPHPSSPCWCPGLSCHACRHLCSTVRSTNASLAGGEFIIEDVFGNASILHPSHMAEPPKSALPPVLLAKVDYSDILIVFIWHTVRHIKLLTLATYSSQYIIITLRSVILWLVHFLPITYWNFEMLTIQIFAWWIHCSSPWINANVTRDSQSNVAWILLAVIVHQHMLATVCRRLHHPFFSPCFRLLRTELAV